MAVNMATPDAEPHTLSSADSVSTALHFAQPSLSPSSALPSPRLVLEETSYLAKSVNQTFALQRQLQQQQLQQQHYPLGISAPTTSSAFTPIASPAPVPAPALSSHADGEIECLVSDSNDDDDMLIVRSNTANKHKKKKKEKKKKRKKENKKKRRRTEESESESNDDSDSGGCDMDDRTKRDTTAASNVSVDTSLPTAGASSLASSSCTASSSTSSAQAQTASHVHAGAILSQNRFPPQEDSPEYKSLLDRLCSNQYKHMNYCVAFIKLLLRDGNKAVFDLWGLRSKQKQPDFITTTDTLKFIFGLKASLRINGNEVVSDEGGDEDDRSEHRYVMSSVRSAWLWFESYWTTHPCNKKKSEWPHPTASSPSLNIHKWYVNREEGRLASAADLQRKYFGLKCHIPPEVIRPVALALLREHTPLQQHIPQTQHAMPAQLFASPQYSRPIAVQDYYNQYSSSSSQSSSVASTPIPVSSPSYSLPPPVYPYLASTPQQPSLQLHSLSRSFSGSSNDGISPTEQPTMQRRRRPSVKQETDCRALVFIPKYATFKVPFTAPAPPKEGIRAAPTVLQSSFIVVQIYAKHLTKTESDNIIDNIRSSEKAMYLEDNVTFQKQAQVMAQLNIHLSPPCIFYIYPPENPQLHEKRYFAQPTLSFHALHLINAAIKENGGIATAAKNTLIEDIAIRRESMSVAPATCGVQSVLNFATSEAAAGKPIEVMKSTEVNEGAQLPICIAVPLGFPFDSSCVQISYDPSVGFVLVFQQQQLEVRAKVAKLTGFNGVTQRIQYDGSDDFAVSKTMPSVTLDTPPTIKDFEAQLQRLTAADFCSEYKDINKCIYCHHTFTQQKVIYKGRPTNEELRDVPFRKCDHDKECGRWMHKACAHMLQAHDIERPFYCIRCEMCHSKSCIDTDRMIKQHNNAVRCSECRVYFHKQCVDSTCTWCGLSFRTSLTLSASVQQTSDSPLSSLASLAAVSSVTPSSSTSTSSSQTCQHTGMILLTTENMPATFVVLSSFFVWLECGNDEEIQMKLRVNFMHSGGSA
jgi:hypothetical protein